MDQRSNGHPGAGWPPGRGADVAYPLDEHPSHPPAPWTSAPVDPPTWASDPGMGGWQPAAWEQSQPGGWPGDDGRGRHEQSWGRDWEPPPRSTSGHDLGPITGPEWPALPRDAATGGPAPAYGPPDPGYGPQGGQAGAGTGGQPRLGYGQQDPGFDAYRYQEPERYDQPGYGQAQPQPPYGGYPADGGYGYQEPNPYDQPGYGQDQLGYGRQAPPADERRLWGPSHGGAYADPPEQPVWDLGARGEQVGYAAAGPGQVQDEGWRHATKDYGQAQEWEQSAGDQGTWGGRGATQAQDWRTPAAAGPRAGAIDEHWDDQASFDAAFAGDQWDEDGAGRPRRRGLVLILGLALVVLLGAVAGATWALTTRNNGGAQPRGGAPSGTVAGTGLAGQGATQPSSGRQVDTDQFSFTAPKDWKDITDKARSSSSVGSRVVTALARTRNDGTGSSIVVTSGDNQTGGEPSIAALGAALKSRTVSEGATKVGDPKPLNLDDGDAVSVDYEGQLRGAPIAGRRVLTIHGDKAYVLVMEGSKDRFAEDLTAFEQVLNSWAWAA